MKFEIRINAPSGDIVPLLVVAAAKAHARATAGGTAFHQTAYEGSLQGFGDDLLREARSGRLKVCGQFGSPDNADELIAEAERTGTLVVVQRYAVKPDWDQLHRENEPVGPRVWNLSHLDFGPSETDWTLTNLGAICTTLKWLNEWAAGRLADIREAVHGRR